MPVPAQTGTPNPCELQQSLKQSCASFLCTSTKRKHRLDVGPARTGQHGAEEFLSCLTSCRRRCEWVKGEQTEVMRSTAESSWPFNNPLNSNPIFISIGFDSWVSTLSQIKGTFCCSSTWKRWLQNYFLRFPSFVTCDIAHQLISTTWPPWPRTGPNNLGRLPGTLSQVLAMTCLCSLNGRSNRGANVHPELWVNHQKIGISYKNETCSKQQSCLLA